MEFPKIILPGDIDIEFRVAELPKGGYGVVCTECERMHAKEFVWTFSHFMEVLAFQKDHRNLHFGT